MRTWNVFNAQGNFVGTVEADSQIVALHQAKLRYGGSPMVEKKLTRQEEVQKHYQEQEELWQAMQWR